MKNQFKMLFMILTGLILIISASGCLDSAYRFEGKVITENGSQPFKNANIYLELVNITDQNHPEVMTSKVIVNGGKNNYTYVLTYDEKLDPKGIYVIQAFVDMDGDKKISSKDYVSKPFQRIEPNLFEQLYDIYVYPYN